MHTFGTAAKNFLESGVVKAEGDRATVDDVRSHTGPASAVSVATTPACWGGCGSAMVIRK